MIYVASSWKNVHQPGVVEALRRAGYNVYDYRHPAPNNDGFRWTDIDADWQNWTPREMGEAFGHPRVIVHFALDMGALQRAEACVLVLPSGNDAHLEAGYAVGKGKPTFIYAPDQTVNAGLMYKMLGGPLFAQDSSSRNWLATDMLSLLNLLQQNAISKG